VDKRNSKLIIKPTLVILSISILFLALLIVPKLFGLYYIYGFADSILLSICLISFFTWIFLIVKNKTRKKWPRIVVVLISVIILLISMPYLMLFSSLSGHVYLDSVSPSGANKLVVFEGGFRRKLYRLIHLLT
jgi:hypothetical protein